MKQPTRILGVDYGTKRVGLAITDADRRMALPLTLHERGNLEHEAQFFRALVETEDIALILVGLPVHMSGDEGQKAAEARAYGKWLGVTTNRPVAFWDERLTTSQAEQLLWDAGLTHKQRKERRDKVAAQILLQSYLEAGCPEIPDVRPLADN